VVLGVFRGTPNTHNAKFSFTTVLSIEGTVKLAPGMGTPDQNTPSFAFCVSEDSFNFWLGMLGSAHNDGINATS
jgi:hypothetical protein